MNSLYNLARVSTATTGTGTITLGAAVSGFLTFAQAGVPDGAVVTYAIEDANGGHEIGQGTYTLSGTTLTRTTVYRSTGAANTGKITLSGSAQVFIAVAAEDLAAIPLGNVTGLGTGVATFLATPSSANLRGALTDESGTGAAIFAGGPTFTGTVTFAGSTQINSTGQLGILGSPAANLHVFGINANPYVANQLGAGPRSYFHNTDPTDGNYERVVFMGTNDAVADIPMGGITLINTAHAAGAETGDMVVQLRNAGTIAEKFAFLASGLFALAGRTASFPALKRSTTIIQARLADDSAYATLDALSILDSGAAPTGTAGSGYVRKTSPQITTPDIVGTATNNDAAAGSVGEFATGSATGVSLTSPNAANIVTLSLTAGDWDVEGTVKFNPAGSTTSTIRQAGVTTTTGTMPTTLAAGTAWARESGAITTGTGPVIATGMARISLSGTTNIFLVAAATFASSTMTADGILKARRRR